MTTFCVVCTEPMTRPILDVLLKLFGLRCEHDFGWPRSRWHGPSWHRYQIHTQTCVKCGLEVKYNGCLQTNFVDN